MKLLALMKKEFHRFFRDGRLILTMLLPGIIIYLLYTVIGATIVQAEKSYSFRVYLGGESETTELISSAVRSAGHELTWLPLGDEASAREAVEKGEASAIMIFSPGFDGAFSGETGAEAKIVFDAADEASGSFYDLATAVLQGCGMRFSVAAESVSDEAAMGTEILKSVLPLLIVCFICSACMSVTLESVAGEKERGTLATILVTSARRSDVVLGKVLPLSAISMLGALSSFLGVALSLPKLTGSSLALGAYSAGSYALLFVLILSIVPLIVAAFATVSTLSRSVKEASAYAGVLMILAMVLSLVAGFLPAMGNWCLLLPVFNAVAELSAVLGGEMPIWQSLVAAGANLAYTALLVLLMAKLLSSEKVTFGS